MKDKIIQITVDREDNFLGLSESGTIYQVIGLMNPKWEVYIKSPELEEDGKDKPKLGDSNYNSGHSIDADGNCNNGCC
jgi:hypothetical protein